MMQMPADILPANTPALSSTNDLPVIDPAAATPEAPSSTEPIVTPTTEPASTEATPVVTTTTESTKSTSAVQERFSTLAAQRREAEARAARLEALAQQQSDQIKSLIDRLGTTTAPADVTYTADSAEFNLPRPSREYFTDPESFESALVTWAGQKAAHEATAIMSKRAEEDAARRVEDERKAAEAKAQEEVIERQNKTALEIQTKWEERKAAAIERHPDFIEVVQNEDLMIPAGSYVAHAVLTREDGPEIGYYLGKNPDEARRIASLVIPNQFVPPGNPNAGMPQPDFIAQAYEIGKIVAKLESALSAPKTEAATAETPNNVLAATAPTTTIAILPTPPTPITGASAEATQRDVNELSMDEYAALRTPQLRSERRPGRSIN